VLCKYMVHVRLGDGLDGEGLANQSRASRNGDKAVPGL
jgi:hypothetical protein